MMNKKAWIKVIEAFIAVTLIIVVLVIILNQQSSQQTDASQSIYNYEILILRNIELNNTLRNETLNVSVLPSTWDNSTFPADVKSKIISLMPSSLTCEAQICATNNTCDFWKTIDTSIYAQSIFITSTLYEYNPLQLKLFCWTKQQ